MYHSSVVVVHPPAAGPAGVVLANNPPRRKPLAMKASASSEAHRVLHPAAGFGSSAAFPGSRPEFQTNYPQYLLQLQGRGGVRLFRAKSCCFGEVVDDGMLSKDFGIEKLSSEKRARVALHLMNNADKTGQASRYVANLKEMYGYGCSTLCLVYNASGETLHLKGQKDWAGSLYNNDKYPEEIGNGQWAAFLHVHGQKEGETDSIGAVLYGGDKLVNGDQARYLLLAWKTPSDLSGQNKAYCRILAADNPQWDDTKANLEKNPSHTSSDKDESPLQVDAEIAWLSIKNSPTFTAIIKRCDAADK